MVNKLISKIKNTMTKNKNLYPLEDNEFMFSTKEIEDLTEQNKQKLENLKKGTEKKKTLSFTAVSKKLNGILDEPKEEVSPTDDISSSDIQTIETAEEKKEPEEQLSSVPEDNKEEKEVLLESVKEVSLEEPIEEKVQKDQPITPEEKDSYINLSEKNQSIIMNCWNKIDLQQIDKDIIEGKDLLNHNYNITYGENAAKFVHDIRKRYEVVICYLIGFNNEKKGIMNKTIFADRVDDEWKFLSNYIKLLEKIRSNRK